MNDLDTSAHSSILSPRPAMLPPKGCRGAVTGWPQLLHAAQMLSARGSSSTAADIGSRTQLTAAIAVNPAILNTATPPQDLYSQFVWFTIRLWTAAKVTAGTLRHLTAVGSASIVRDALTGPHGLRERAGAIAATADDLGERVARVRSARQLAAHSELMKDAAENLERHAREAAEARPLETALFESYAAAAAERLHFDLEQWQAGAAGAAADAVLANLAEFFLQTATEWRALRDTFEAVDFDIDGLDLDSAAAEWNDYARTIRNFITGLLRAKAD